MEFRKKYTKKKGSTNLQITNKTNRKPLQNSTKVVTAGDCNGVLFIFFPAGMHIILFQHLLFALRKTYLM